MHRLLSNGWCTNSQIGHLSILFKKMDQPPPNSFSKSSNSFHRHVHVSLWIIALFVTLLLADLAIGIAALVKSTNSSSITEFTSSQTVILQELTQNFTITSNGSLSGPGFICAGNALTTQSQPFARFSSLQSTQANTDPLLFEVINSNLKVGNIVTNEVIFRQDPLDSKDVVKADGDGFLVQEFSTGNEALLGFNGLEFTNAAQSNVLFSIGDTGNAVITCDTNKFLDVLAGVHLFNVSTANRPTSPPDGTLIYDTTLLNMVLFSNGSWVPAGTVSGTAGQIAVNSGVISLVDTAVTAGTYSYPTFTVDAQGRLTAASSNPSPVASVSGTSQEIKISGTATNPIVGFATESKAIIDSWGSLMPAASPSPTDRQFLQYQTSPGKLVWVNALKPFPSSRTIYVDKSGNDTTGDGTNTAPFLTVIKAFQVGMVGNQTSLSNQTVIMVGGGIYTEDNTSGAFTIAASGFSLIGSSSRGTTIKPLDPTKDLFIMTNVNFTCANIRWEPAITTSTARGFVISGNFSTVFNNCLFRFWQLAIDISGNGYQSSSLLCDNCLFGHNNLCIQVTNANLLLNDSQLRGSLTSPTPDPLINGILAKDATTVVYIAGSLFTWFGYGIRSTNGCAVFVSACQFIFNTKGVQVDNLGQMIVDGCSFSKLDNVSGTRQIGIQCFDTGSKITATASTIDGRNVGGSIEGIGMQVTLGATSTLQGCSIVNCYTGIQLGVTGGTDTASTSCQASSTGFDGNTPESVHLYGACTLSLVMITIDDDSTIILDSSDHVKLLMSNINSGHFMAIGPLTNTDFGVMEISTKPTLSSNLHYKPNIYSAESLCYINPDSVNGAWTVMGQNDTSVNVISQVSTSNYEASLRLVSDTSGDAGTSVRGWRIYKTGGTTPNAQLNFAYKNTIGGQDLISETTMVQIDSSVISAQKFRLLDNKLTFHSDDDTLIFRNSAGVLRTSGNWIIDGLTANTALATNGSKQIVSSGTSATELGYLSGVTSAIQTQLNSKLPLSAGGSFPLSGSLFTIQGTASTPAINIASNSGIYSGGSGDFAISTSGVAQLKLDNAGQLQLFGTNYSTQAVLHNSAAGIITSSKIIDDDIEDGTITNAKLFHVSSANNNDYLVVRNGSGSFSATMIDLSGTPTAANDVTTKSYVDAKVSTGIVFHTPVRLVATSPVDSGQPSGPHTIDSVPVADNDRILLTAQTDAAFNGPWVANTTIATDWTRPTDFANGNAAGAAYFLVLEGTLLTGSAWICSTPSAIIGDPNTISFSEFSIPTTISGTNLGTGTGAVFKPPAVGTNLNFRTLINRTSPSTGFMIIANDTNEVTLAVDATSANTASKVVARDSSGNFIAGTITASLNGTANGNLPSNGGTLTGPLILPIGSDTSPSLSFTGTGVGLSSLSNGLQISTGASGASVLQMSVSSAGAVTIPSLNATGIVHNSNAGLLTTSLIVDADVSGSAAIVDTKLATISTAGKVANSATTATDANTFGAIVARDGSGNFTATTVTANLVGNVTGSASLNVLKAGDTMGGPLVMPLGAATAPSLTFTGTGVGFSSVSNGLQISTGGSGASALHWSMDSTGALTLNQLSTAGVVHNATGGLLSTSLIVNADVSASAAIVDTKLATISTAGKVSNSATTATDANTASAIVARDSSGNFSAGTVTLSGGGIFPIGLATSPSLSFTGTGVGFSSLSNGLQISTGASGASVLRMTVGSTGTVTIPNLSSTGIVHNSSAGLLTTSLIVDADVSASAAIVDTKLATISTAGKVSNTATTATDANTPNAIVSRDSSGNFSAGTVTLSGGAIFPIGLATSPSLSFTGTGVGFSSLSNGLQISTGASGASVLRMTVGSTGTVTIPNLNATGIVHNSSAGLLTTSLIVDADVSASAAIVDTKLATISTAGKVANSATTATNANTASAIVARDASGNFTAGTVTLTTLTMANITSTGVNGRIIIGNSASGSGLDDVVIGTSAAASTANSAVVIGPSASASAGANNAVAIGNTASGTAPDSVALGHSAAATTSAVALGPGATASSTGTIAIGRNVTTAVGGGANTVVGDTGNATGVSNTVVGANSTATSDNAAICGRSSSAGNGSVILGVLSTATTDGICIGNVCTSSASKAFVIGNGVSNSTTESLLISTGALTNIRSDATCNLGTLASPFQSLFISSGVDCGTSAVAISLGGTNASSIGIGHGTITTSVTGTFACTHATGTLYNPASNALQPTSGFTAGTAKLLAPTAGNVTAGVLSEFTQTGAQLTYTGARTRNFMISMTVVFVSTQAAGASGTLRLFVSKQGVLTNPPVGQAQAAQFIDVTKNQNQRMTLTLTDVQSLANNQTLQPAASYSATVTQANSPSFEDITLTATALLN